MKKRPKSYRPRLPAKLEKQVAAEAAANHRAINTEATLLIAEALEARAKKRMGG